jgi:hypothetical protein
MHLVGWRGVEFAPFPSSFHFSESIIRVGPNKLRIKRIKKI